MPWEPMLLLRRKGSDYLLIMQIFIFLLDRKMSANGGYEEGDCFKIRRISSVGQS